MRQLAWSFVFLTTAESSMNKKLLTLAVAAAVAAPSAAMAEAVLYGKLHVHVDYVNVDNIVGIEYETVDTFNVTGVTTPVGDSTTNIYGTGAAATANLGPGSAGFVAQAEGVPTWINNTGSTVYVPLEDGTVATVGNGQYLVGVTMPGTAGIAAPSGEPVTLIVTDGAGTPIINKENAQDFDGWGVDSESWRKFTTVNPGTGIETTAQGPANRVGVKGSEDLGNGLKAVYQVEFGVNFASADNAIPSGRNGGVSIRNSFVGLAGDWGTALVGRHDTPLKISTGKLDLFADTIADYNGTVGFHDVRADNVVAYISPSFSGFSFMGATVAGGGATAFGDLNYENTSLASAYSLAMIYNNGPFYGSAAYEVLSNEMFMDGATSNAGSSQCVGSDGSETLSCGYVGDDFSKWRLGLGILDWNGFTLTAIYENQDDLPGGQIREATGFVNPETGQVSFAGTSGVKSQDLWQVQAGYSFGNNMFKAMYGSVNRDAGKALSNVRGETLAINNISNLASGLRKDLEGDRQTWAVGFDHNFSKRTKAYVLYTDVDDDFDGVPGYNGVSWNGFSLGMIHKF
jgi:predicted porin